MENALLPYLACGRGVGGEGRLRHDCFYAWRKVYALESKMLYVEQRDV